nr:hypothetical protein [Prevotella sp.]
MHKHIFIISALAICLLSCSSPEQDDLLIPEPLKGSISFGGNSGTWQDAPTTRANEETGLETISKSFKVWGYKTIGGNNTGGFDHYQNVMDGYLVNWTQQTANPTSSNTADWEYVGIANQTIKYWDYSATSYRFFAYSIPTAAGNITAPTFSEPSTKEGSTTTQASFSIPFNYDKDATNVSTPYISDLWLSDNQNFENRKYGACVKLTFAPIITKVRFKFNYQAESQVSITNISFRNVNDVPSPTSGNIIITYPITGMDTQASYIWETTGTETEPINFTIPYEEEGDLNHQTTTRKKWYFVPPLGDSKTTQQSAYIITADINGKKATATVPAEFMQWKAGYQYTYIFKITEAGTNIAFTNMKVEKWVETPIKNNGGTEDW